MRNESRLRRACATVAMILALGLLLCLGTAALAEGALGGAWKNADESAADAWLAFDEDGAFERYDASGRLLDAGLYARDGDALLLYTGAERFTQRFAERAGWMDLTDALGETTAWFNATPDDAANAGLAPDAKKPLVGVWSQMADDTAIRLLELYDDGVFAFAEPTGEGDDQLGRYELLCGTLTLCPIETAYQFTILEGDAGEAQLDIAPEDGAAQRFARAAGLPFAPTLEALQANRWASADGATEWAFAADSAEIGGLRFDYVLRGALLYLSCDDPIGSKVVGLRLADGQLIVSGVDAYGKPVETVLEAK